MKYNINAYENIHNRNVPGHFLTEGLEELNLFLHLNMNGEVPYYTTFQEYIELLTYPLEYVSNLHFQTVTEIKFYYYKFRSW